MFKAKTVLSVAAVLVTALSLGACSSTWESVSASAANVNCRSGMGQNVTVCHTLRAGEEPNNKTALNNF